jgi:hypothetical protein
MEKKTIVGKRKIKFKLLINVNPKNKYFKILKILHQQHPFKLLMLSLLFYKIQALANIFFK